MKRRTRVYVAGAYSADTILGILNNMRMGMEAGKQVLLAGYAPYVPWHDYHHTLMMKDDESVQIEDYYEYTISWLLGSDYMLVLPGYENSHGVKKEIEVATEAGIATFFSLQDLIDAAPLYKTV